MKTVNFIEAVNSGKRFRRENNMLWLFWNSEKLGIESESGVLSNLNIGLINSQFFIEEKKVTITETELEDACKESLNEMNSAPFNRNRTLFIILKEKLGFES